jgi:uncharacterized protein (UPF0333 family)
VEYTIEARELTSEPSRPAALKVDFRSTTVEARNPKEAIRLFVSNSASELMSFATPGDGRESVGTVRKNDTIFLVRVYQN